MLSALIFLVVFGIYPDGRVWGYCLCLPKIHVVGFLMVVNARISLVGSRVQTCLTRVVSVHSGAFHIWVTASSSLIAQQVSQARSRGSVMNALTSVS